MAVERSFVAKVEKDVCEVMDLDAQSFEIEALRADASTRRYYRVRSADGTRPSLVVMRLPDDPFASEEASGGGPLCELPFVNVQRFLFGRGIRVPEIFRDRTKQGFLLIEDLGDRTLEMKLADTDKDQWPVLYRVGLDLLAEFKRAHFALEDSDCIAAGRAFDFELLRWELDHFTEWAIEADAGRKYSTAHKRIIDAAFDEIAGKLAGLPRFLTHRDFQSRNLMVLPDGKLSLIDFQDALMGPLVYDVVALLRDSYVDVSPWLDELLEAARTRLAVVQQLSVEEFRRQFFLQTLQRKLKDWGRFVFIDRVKHNPSFLKHVPLSIAYVKDALSRLPEYAEVWEVLAYYRSELAP